MLSSDDTAANGMLAAADGDDAGPYLINLCTVTGPIAIPQPRSRHLSRFTFFCTRGQSGDRQTWWLRLGYFSTREEAQKWLERLTRMYPNATIAEAEFTFGSEPFGSDLNIAPKRS